MNQQGIYEPETLRRIGRRAFLQNGTLLLAAATLDVRSLQAEPAASGLRFGLMTDLHYADKPPASTRYYRQTVAKLDEASGQFERDQPAFLVELGDLIDAAPEVATELRYLSTINRQLSAISPDRHYVLGNHCVDTLTKDEFLGGVEQARSYYSFERGDWHFVVLDACFRGDGEPYGRRNFDWTDPNIPPEELEWLKADLEQSQRPVVVFAHQRLDVGGSHGVKNGPQVRSLLEASGKVRAVFQGHSHQNDLREINSIPYCTLVAMVEGSGEENNGYALVDLAADGTIRVRGFRKQRDYDWQAAG